MNWKRFSKMRLYAFLFLPLFVILSFSTKAQNKEDLFAKANKAYASGNFEVAQRDYASIIEDGTHSFAVYYNLGNTYYRKGDLAHAVLYYEKARKLKPAHEAVKANIALVNAKLTDKVEVLPEFFLFRVWRGVFMALSLDAFAVVSLVFLWMAVAAFVIYLFANQVMQKKVGFYSGLGLAFVGLLCIFLANRQSSFLAQNKEGIVIPTSVTVKSAPQENAKTLFIVHNGLKLRILAEQDNWLKIELPNGNTGWAQLVDVAKI